MKSEVAQRLLALNRQFYTELGASFSATRGRIQPGVRRVLDSLYGGETILDLGCGNGGLARALGKNGHRGAYLGLDFSLPLLAETGYMPEGFPAQFIETDLASDWEAIARSAAIISHPQGTQSPHKQEIAKAPRRGTPPAAARTSSPKGNGIFDIIFSFATLHHIPSRALRLNLLEKTHELLAEGGRFIHSNWQFLNSPRLRQRVREWSEAGLATSDVDPGDFLLDWRSGGRGLRYVHHFSEQELAGLAEASGFRVIETFYSDGKEGNLAIYQAWIKA